MPRRLLLAFPLGALAALSTIGCQPPPVVSPSAAAPAETAERIAASLTESGIECQPTKESFVHCTFEGVDVVLGVTLASTGVQLTMMVPFQQPACAVPAYHARIAKFNAEYFMVVAGCVGDKTLILSHRSHLFRAGLDKKDLHSIVKHWTMIAVGTASEAGLLEPAAEGPAEPTPKKKKPDEPVPNKVKGW
ncbi:MAG: YbjN domain-containing protein [Deltaproteobacteria bacterium]|nr:YbjN domain-containing protein [Deltaproteobacteria bacterium]